MAGAQPEEKVTAPFAYQSWRDMTFLHWRFDPAVIAPLLPDPLRPHLHDGSAWVGLTPFRIEGFRPPVLPPLPGLSSFPETNLRTYAVDPDGRDGIHFFSLEADSLATTVAARAFNVPYHWAAMRVEWHEGSVRYISRRRIGTPATHDITVLPGAACTPDELTDLDHWLTGRWRSWARPAGRLSDVPVEHQPWPLRHAEVLELDETLFTTAGLPAPGEQPLVHFSAGVDARLGPPRLRSFS